MFLDGTHLRRTGVITQNDEVRNAGRLTGDAPAEALGEVDGFVS
jgi:hypothetical protein